MTCASAVAADPKIGGVQVVQRQDPGVNLGSNTNLTVNGSSGYYFIATQTNNSYLTFTNILATGKKVDAEVELRATGTNAVTLQGLSIATPGNELTFTVPAGVQFIDVLSRDGTNFIYPRWLGPTNTSSGVPSKGFWMTGTNGGPILLPSSFSSISELSNGDLLMVTNSRIEKVAASSIGGGGTPANTIIARSGSSIVISNTVNETTLWTNTIPAGSLGTNKTAVLNAVGYLIQNATASAAYTIRVYVNDTKVYDDVTVAYSQSAYARIWRISMWLSALDSTTSELLTINYLAGTAGAGTTGTGRLNSSSASNVGLVRSTALTEDSTSDISVKITVAPASASASMEFTMQHYRFFIE